MRNLLLVIFNTALVAVTSTAAPTDPQTWPQFRGPNCSGTVARAKPPEKIGPTNNVQWKIEVPWAPSSPCVWNDRIFLTTFTNGQLETRGYAAQTGKLLWSSGIKPEKLETFHSTEGSPAAATPASDGRHVVSYFGSYGLICHDLEGKELWRKQLPVAVSGGGFGSGTSPAIAGKVVLLNRDQDEHSSLLAADVDTGKTVWEAVRPDAIGSFGTPIVWKNKDVEEVVMPGSVRLKGYDLKNGHERWMVEGVTGFACTTPVAGDGLLFFAGWSPGKSDSPWPAWEKFVEKHDKDHDGVIKLEEFDAASREFMRGMDRDRDGKITREDWKIIEAIGAKAENVLVAVQPGGQGDISKTHVAWKATRGLPYVASPLYYDGRVYVIRDGGMMSSFDARSGKPFYLQERLEATEAYHASPVAADGKIYVVSVSGKLTVVKAGGDRPEILHQAAFGERVFATPALVGDRIYFRTQSKLYAFGEQSRPAIPSE
jgi:outer membrane protein assembly factor BamB